MPKTPHEILGVFENADIDTIKRAYKRLSMHYHPNNQETGNAEKFREINEAYEQLGGKTAHKKSRYAEEHPEEFPYAGRSQDVAPGWAGNRETFPMEAITACFPDLKEKLEQYFPKGLGADNPALYDHEIRTVLEHKPNPNDREWKAARSAYAMLVQMKEHDKWAVPKEFEFQADHVSGHEKALLEAVFNLDFPEALRELQQGANPGIAVDGTTFGRFPHGNPPSSLTLASTPYSLFRDNGQTFDEDKAAMLYLLLSESRVAYDLNAVDRIGFTPLMHLAASKTLLFADFHEDRPSDHTFVPDAYNPNMTEAAMGLIDSGSDVNFRNANGMHAVASAILAINIGVLQPLAAYGKARLGGDFTEPDGGKYHKNLSSLAHAAAEVLDYKNPRVARTFDHLAEHELPGTAPKSLSPKDNLKKLLEANSQRHLPR